MFQQITGINTVIYYAPTLLQGAGLRQLGRAARQRGQRGVNVGMTIVAIWLLDKVGRRPLLLTGTAGMAVGHDDHCRELPRGRQPARRAARSSRSLGLIVYTGSFAIGLGPVSGC